MARSRRRPCRCARIPGRSTGTYPRNMGKARIIAPFRWKAPFSACSHLDRRASCESVAACRSPAGSCVESAHRHQCHCRSAWRAAGHSPAPSAASAFVAIRQHRRLGGAIRRRHTTATASASAFLKPHLRQPHKPRDWHASVAKCGLEQNSTRCFLCRGSTDQRHGFILSAAHLHERPSAITPDNHNIPVVLHVTHPPAPRSQAAPRTFARARSRARLLRNSR